MSDRRGLCEHTPQSPQKDSRGSDPSLGSLGEDPAADEVEVADAVEEDLEVTTVVDAAEPGLQIMTLD